MLSQPRLLAVLLASLVPLLALTGGSTAGSASSAPIIGVNCSRDPGSDPGKCQASGTKLARLEFSIASSPSSMDGLIGAYAAKGIEVQPLAGFAGRLPSTAEAQGLRNWALRFGPGGTFWQGRSDGHLATRNIEFGNETSYSYQYGDNYSTASYAQRARDYALRAKDASTALSGTGVGLLVQAEDGGSGSSNWVNQMFSAVPDLDRRVSAWTVHPYGPQGSAKIDRMLSHLAARGASTAVPFAITEWGLASDNGRPLSDNYGYPTNLTYDQAAATLRDVVAGWRSRYGGRFGELMLYQHADRKTPGSSTDREFYFGVVRMDGTVKGSYTAEVRALMGSAASTPQLPVPTTPPTTPSDGGGSQAPPQGSVEKAQGKPATASSSEPAAHFAPRLANDGDPNTRWSSLFQNDQWWQVDLGSSRSVNSVMVTFNRWAWPRTYLVSTSTDGSSWSVAASETLTAAGTKASTFAQRSARYVRITGTTRGTSAGTSIEEAKVYGPADTSSTPSGPTQAIPPSGTPPAGGGSPVPPQGSVEKAQGKPATASSSEPAAHFAPQLANDGDPNTRWSSLFQNDQWWQVDLGSNRSVDSVTITFNRWAWPRTYQVSTSTDGSSWSVAASETLTAAGTKTSTFALRSARYVRITGTARGTSAGTSIEEAKVYGPADGAAASRSAPSQGEPKPAPAPAPAQPTGSSGPAPAQPPRP